jgi:hypothetical protein
VTSTPAGDLRRAWRAPAWWRLLRGSVKWRGAEEDEAGRGRGGLLLGEVWFCRWGQFPAACRFTRLDEELLVSAGCERHEQSRLRRAHGEGTRRSAHDGPHRSGMELVVGSVDVQRDLTLEQDKGLLGMWVRVQGVAFPAGTHAVSTEMLPLVWCGRAFMVIKPPSYQYGSPSSAAVMTALPSHMLHMASLSESQT